MDKITLKALYVSQRYYAPPKVVILIDILVLPTDLPDT